MEFTSRQIEIIKASTELIALKGIQHLTTKNLAVEMGFSEPAIYRHFKSKTAILEGILSFYQNEMRMKIQPVMQSEMNALEKLTKILEIQFNHFSETPAIVSVIFSETSFQNEIVLSETVKNIVKNKLKLTEQMILSGQNEGIIRKDISASNLATMYIGCLRFSILKWSINNNDFDLNKEAIELNKMIEILMT